MADDLTRPYIGYRSAGRRPETQQDRRASADAPLAALRGMVSGVLGAPGDIESLVRMLPGLSEQTYLPTSEDIERRLPLRSVSETPIGRVATGMGTLGGGFYTGPGSPLRAAAALPSAVRRAGADFAAAAGQPAVNVVKPKGGNWLAGSVERAIEPMKKKLGREDELMRQLQLANPDLNVEQARAVIGANLRPSESDIAMNRWLETKLAKYMRNEMATPEDPIRALADRGVTHIPEGIESLERVTEWIPEALESRRKAAGFPAGGMSQTPYGQGWEQLSDQAIHNMPARMRVNPDSGGGSMIALQTEKDNPWLMKVPPETMTYGAYPVEVRSELGFEHLVDELRNAVNPESGLPSNLLWKYSDLDKVTVPQAVERVAKINDWRAAQKAEADMARAMNPATQVVKEYPEQGFKWVELKAAETDPAQLRITPRGEYEGSPGGFNVSYKDKHIGWGQTEDEAQALAANYRSDAELSDALKYEGETMGHCVGGGDYCLDVVEGRSKIFSLRDKKGQPHVTIEVSPRRPTVEQATKIAIDEGLPPKGMETLERVAQIMADPAFGTQDIVQIKGKANRAPKEEYLPAVQDFVRSGNWGRVGDLQNTGLIDARAAGKPLPGRPAFMTEDEFKAYEAEIKGEGFALGGLVQKYAGGGMVSNGQTGNGLVGSNIYNSDAMQNPASAYRFADGGQAGDVRAYADGGLVANSHTADFDPARIDAIVGDLNALNAG